MVQKRRQKSGGRGHPGETRYAVVNEFHRAGISEGVRLRAEVGCQRSEKRDKKMLGCRRSCFQLYANLKSGKSYSS